MEPCGPGAAHLRCPQVTGKIGRDQYSGQRHDSDGAVDCSLYGASILSILTIVKGLGSSYCSRRRGVGPPRRVLSHPRREVCAATPGATGDMERWL